MQERCCPNPPQSNQPHPKSMTGMQEKYIKYIPRCSRHERMAPYRRPHLKHVQNWGMICMMRVSRTFSDCGLWRLVSTLSACLVGWPSPMIDMLGRILSSDRFERPVHGQAFVHTPVASWDNLPLRTELASSDLVQRKIWNEALWTHAIWNPPPNQWF